MFVWLGGYYLSSGHLHVFPHIQLGISGLKVSSKITVHRVQPWACVQSPRLPGMTVILLLGLSSTWVRVAHWVVNVSSDVLFKPCMPVQLLPCADDGSLCGSCLCPALIALGVT